MVWVLSMLEPTHFPMILVVTSPVWWHLNNIWKFQEYWPSIFISQCNYIQWLVSFLSDIKAENKAENEILAPHHQRSFHNREFRDNRALIRIDSSTISKHNSAIRHNINIHNHGANITIRYYLCPPFRRLLGTTHIDRNDLKWCSLRSIFQRRQIRSYGGLDCRGQRRKRWQRWATAIQPKLQRCDLDL